MKGPEDILIAHAAERLKAGELVAFPTETVYGLGAPIFQPETIEKIFKVKGRPSDNPLIAHIATLEQVEQIAVEIPAEFYSLASHFFPGPLTLVLKKHPSVPTIASGGLETIAVRMPAHPIARALILAVGQPLVAPSANLSGKPSSTTAAHVREDFGAEIVTIHGVMQKLEFDKAGAKNLSQAGPASKQRLCKHRCDADGSQSLGCPRSQSQFSNHEVYILDGGATQFGIESTVVSLLVDPPILLRPGSITKEAIEAVLKRPIREKKGEDAVVSPGVKYRHYAPKAKVMLVREHPTEIVRGRVVVTDISAHNLYQTLRTADQQGFAEILIVCSPQVLQDHALMNRLQYAAGLLTHSDA